MSNNNSNKFQIIYLILVAPIIGEGLSTSTPFIGFLNPLNLILLVALYGFGALIIRELTVRWRGSIHWPTIMILGLVYGIIEEGLFLLSMLNPNYPSVGQLGSYGRFWDVNWVWAMHIALFHSIFSISLSILITELSFPTSFDKKLLGKKALGSIILLFVISGMIWLLYVITDYKYKPSLEQYIFLLVLAIILFFFAKNGSNRIKLRGKSSSSWFVLVLSIIISVTYFLFPYLSIIADLSPIVPFIFQPIIVLLLIYSLSGNLGTTIALRKKSLILWIGLVSFCFVFLLANFLDFIAFGIIILVLILNANKSITRNSYFDKKIVN